MLEGRVELVGVIGNVPVLKPRVSLAVANINGVQRNLTFTVDTGFTGWLTVPGDVIRDLDLQYRGTRPYVLADDEVSEAHLYLAFVASVPVVVHQLDAEPLLGAAMMNVCRLTVDFWEGGRVTIESRAELA